MPESPLRWFRERLRAVLGAARGEGRARVAFEGAARTRLVRLLDEGGEIPLPSAAEPMVSVVILLHGKAHLTLECLSTLPAATTLPTEVVLVDNASRDETGELLERQRGATVLRQAENLGFVRGCNLGADAARGELLLFLNNDTSLLPGVVDRLAATAGLADDVGAVGGRLVHPDGRLQEAGSIVWADGATDGYGRGDDPEAPEYMFRRQVDYCSGALLLTPRRLFRELGGFDEAFAPAYYEEVDYCFRLRAAGYRTLYEPEASLVHLEFGSAGDRSEAVELQREHRTLFRERHRDALAERPQGRDHLRARSVGVEGPRVLFVDDRVPHPSRGRGFPRAAAIVSALASRAGSVTVFPTLPGEEPWPEVYADVPREVEVVQGPGAAGLPEHLRDRSGFYDVVLVSRPENLARVLEVRATHPEALAGARLVYDSEALAASWEAAEREVLGPALAPEEVRERLAEEIGAGAEAEVVLTASEGEATQFREAGHERVLAFPHRLDPHPGPRGFREREGLLFVGTLPAGTTANSDSMSWFVGQVLPHLRRLLPEVRLRIVGRVENSTVRDLAGPDVELVGFAEDLEELHDGARLFVAPTRFCSGIPLKVLEAAARGLPVVLTELLLGQLGWRAGRDCLAADRRDPVAFAGACARLYSDEDLWESVRAEALERIRESCGEERLQRLADEVLRPA